MRRDGTLHNLIKLGLLASAVSIAAAAATRWWLSRGKAKAALDNSSADDSQLFPPIGGRGMPVDHERPPGVPPATNTDYLDEVDFASAMSFPASDPPQSW